MPTQGIPLALRARGTQINARYNVNNFVDKKMKKKLHKKKISHIFAT